MPVIAVSVICIIAKHVNWLDGVRGVSAGCLFPARKSARKDGKRVHIPVTQPERAMSVDSFRFIIRQALVECCGLLAAQSA